MVSRSAQLPNTHLRKEWQRYVRTWFNQPARKQKRRLARQQKAAKNGIRPVGLLRPVVHCPTQKYNMKAVNISRRVALSMGIAVDHRRRNKSQESVIANINRLKLYLSKLVLFQRGSKAKKGCAGVPADTPKSQIQNVKQTAMATALPIEQPHRKIRVGPCDHRGGEEVPCVCHAEEATQKRQDCRQAGEEARREGSGGGREEISACMSMALPGQQLHQNITRCREPLLRRSWVGWGNNGSPAVYLAERNS
ncbi:60s ribosomal protein [Cyclospora cayetanensis]|uniref:60s ribosomal protein n=1 Tax=Cyclospora cayetanensis TaxID=88456 RepID=A0A1D3CV42_9EIME|nr:60s ribosomal protein [Cyclospora cayetanensis]